MATHQPRISEQEWFKTCPIGLLALDSEGVICGLNPALEAMTGLRAADCLGQCREEPPPAVRPLLEKTPVLHLQGPEGERWLQREIRELTDEKITLLYFQDITERCRLQRQNEQLARQMEELAVTDTLTGLTNRRALTRMLDAQVTRSRRYQNPLSLALAEVIPQNSEAVSDELILTVSNYLRDRLRWADVLGRWEDNRFMLMLPETPEEAASTLIENIRNGVADLATAGGQQAPAFRLRFALTAWTKGVDTQHLTRQVESALDAAETPMAS